MDQTIPPAPPPPKKPFHPYFQKLFVPFLAVLILAVGLVVGVPLLRRAVRFLTPASTNLVDLSFAPSANSLQRGEQFTVNVLIDPHDLSVSAASMAATFSPTHLRVVSATAGPFFTSGIPGGYSAPLNIVNNQEPGKVSVIAGAACPLVVPTPNPATTPCTVRNLPGIFATLNMEVLATAPLGTTSLSFDTTDGRTSAAQVGQDTDKLGDANPVTLTIIAPPTSTPASSPTSTPAAQTLQMSVRLQGITTQKPAKVLAVELVQGRTLVWSGNIDTTSDTTGKYTGSTNITAPAGSYDIYVKAPSRLKRKFAGRTIVASTNTFDLSSPLLLSGDFNNDNTIQFSDLTGVISVWIQSDTPVTPSNQQYDIEENGSISFSDVTAVISNWTSSVVSGDNY